MLFSCLSVKIGSMSCPPCFSVIKSISWFQLFSYKNCVSGYRKYAGKCPVFHDFYGIDSSAVLCLQDDLWMVFLKCTPWDLKRARHTASGSLSESPDGVHLEYPAIEKHYGRAVSSGSRIRIRLIGRIFIEVRRRLQNANMQREHGSR